MGQNALLEKTADRGALRPADGFLTYEPAALRRNAPQISDVRANAGEVLGRFSDIRDPEAAATAARNELWVKAKDRGLSFSAYLEEIDPSWRYNDGLDAFDRQLLIAGIRTQSDPARGIYADVVDRFYMSDQPASPVLFPEFINRQVRIALLAPPILDELTAITTPIEGDAYRAIYLNDTASQRRMSRVAEGAALPTVKLVTSERTINLKKYGVKLEGTYEAFRRMRIDMFSLHLARIAMQTQLDKSSDALDTLINGDGNSNAATNYNLTALDSGTTAGNLTYKAWLRFGLKFFPYQVTTVVAGEAELMAILTLQFPNLNPLMLLSMLTAGQPVDMKLELAQNIWTTIRLVFLSTAPANVVTGINKSTALELVTEVGSSITETDRIISRQTNEITISEVVGFACLIDQARATLTLNA